MQWDLVTEYPQLPKQWWHIRMTRCAALRGAVRPGHRLTPAANTMLAHPHDTVCSTERCRYPPSTSMSLQKHMYVQAVHISERTCHPSDRGWGTVPDQVCPWVGCWRRLSACGEAV